MSNNKIKAILFQGIEWINFIAAIYLVATLILPFSFQKPALYTYFISLSLDIIINQRYKNVQWNKTKLTFIAMILFYSCIWIWHIFEESNISHFYYVSEERLPFLVFGLFGLFTKINPRLKPQYFAIPMLLSSTLWSLFIIYQINIFSNPTLTFTQYQDAFVIYRNNILGSTHMNFNLYLNFSIMFGIYALYTFKNIWLKLIHILGIIIVFCILFTSEGRVGFFTANILIIGLIYFNIAKLNKKLAIPTITLACIGLFFIINNHQRVKDTNVLDDARSDIWEHSAKIIKEKPLLGYGVSDGRKAFIENTTEEENFAKSYLKTLYILYPNLKGSYTAHPHNVFIESTIEFGIIGLFLFSSIMLIPLFSTKGRKRIFLTQLIFIFGMQSLFETLWAFLPSIYLCWFLYILILNPIEENTKTTDLRQK